MSNPVRYLSALGLTAAFVGAILGAGVIFVGSVTGATVAPRDIAAAQSIDPKLIAVPFDLIYWGSLKIERIAQEQPEVVEIGSSRGMELRSAMFKPYRFYNAALTAWSLDQALKMVEMVSAVSKPRVIILGLDYFMFTDRYADAMKPRTMLFNTGLSSVAHYKYRATVSMIKELWKSRELVWRAIVNWGAGVKPATIGLNALKGATGFRFDGSMQMPVAVYPEAAGKVRRNEGLIEAVPGGPEIDAHQIELLSRIGALCKEKGITLVGVQLPFAKATVDFLSNDASYHYYSGVWREFESDWMEKKMAALGVEFFDLSHDPITANPELFIDAAHLTESGMALALAHLLDNERFQAIFPKLSAAQLIRDRNGALTVGDRYEIYHSAF